jgi:hypothetical protein
MIGRQVPFAPNDSPDREPDGGPHSLNGYDAANGHLAEATTEKQPKRAKGGISPLPLVDPVEIADITPPLRSWLVDGLIPEGHVTELFGKPTVGKSLILQQLGIAGSTGQPWLRLPVKRGKALAFFCEDDADELHRRAIAICRSLNISGRPPVGEASWVGESGKELFVPDQAGTIYNRDQLASMGSSRVAAT